MSTRGAFGFRHNNTDKICFNSMDSDLWGLGSNAIDAILTHSNESLKTHYYKISFDKSSSIFEGDNIFFQETYKDASEFIKEGLHCEWAYILNLDTQKLEIYSGFHAPAGQGRYNLQKTECKKEYGGVALVCEVSFDIVRALFSKPKYSALAAKFHAMVNEKAEYSKINFQYLEDLNYSLKDIENYFLTLESIDCSTITVLTFEAGVEFTCNGTLFLKISDKNFAAIDLGHFCLYPYSWFENKDVYLVG